MASMLRFRSSGEPAVLELPLPPSDERLCAAYGEAYHAKTLCCQNVMCGPVCVPLGLAAVPQGLYVFMLHKQSGELTRQLLDAARYPLLCKDISDAKSAFLADGPLLLLLISGGGLRIYDLLQPEIQPLVIQQHEDLQSPQLSAKQLDWSSLTVILKAQTAYGYGVCRIDAPPHIATSSSSSKKARVEAQQEQGSADAQQHKLLSVAQLRLARLRTKNGVLRSLAVQKCAILWSLRRSVEALSKGEARGDYTLPQGLLSPLGTPADAAPPPPLTTATRAPCDGVEVVEVLPCLAGNFYAVRVRNSTGCAVFDISATMAAPRGSRSCSCASVLLPGDETFLLASAGDNDCLQILLSYSLCPRLDREAIEARTLVSTADPSVAYLALSESDAMQRRATMLPLALTYSANEQRQEESIGRRLMASLQSARGKVSLHGFLLGAVFHLSSTKPHTHLLGEVLEALKGFFDSDRLAHYMLCGSRLAWFAEFPVFLRSAAASAREPASTLAAMLRRHIPALGTGALHCSSSYTTASFDVLLDALLDEFKLLSILWRKHQRRSSRRSNGSLLFFASEDGEQQPSAKEVCAASGLQMSMQDMRLLLVKQRQTDDIAVHVLTSSFRY